jgi:hypothetical protein
MAVGIGLLRHDDGADSLLVRESARTISPGLALNVTVRVATSPVEFRSSHVIDVRAQPCLDPSVDVYVPGETSEEIVPPDSEIEPAGVPANSNVPVPPTITFSMMTMLRLRFRKVHVTVSPSSTLKVAVRLEMLPDEFSSSHPIEPRFQPAFVSSVDVY